jgi:hypothetical protein
MTATHFLDNERLRRCRRCQQGTVAVVQTTQHLLNHLLPIGRTYRHRCQACGAEMVTESVGRTLFLGAVSGGVLTFALPLAIGMTGVVLDALGPAPLDAIVREARGPGGLENLAIAAAFVGGAGLVLAGALFVPTRSVLRWIRLLRSPPA